MSRKSRWNSTESSSLQTLLIKEISEKTLNEELENCIRLGTTWRSEVWSEEIQNMHYSSHNVSLNLED